MSQTSYFYNGTWNGDAINAPYTAKLFSELTRTVRQPDKGVVFRYLNNLAVTISGTIITIDTGAALVAGVYCEQTSSSTLTLLPGSSSYTRYDRVVIRVIWETQEVSFVYKQGISSINPEPPELTQIPGEVYEMPLARLRVTSKAATITNANIWDEREFYEDVWHKNNYATKNLMPNSELIMGVQTGEDNLPAMWRVTSGTVADVTAMEKFDNMSRGTTVQMTLSTRLTDRAQCGVRLTTSATLPVTVRIMAHVIQGEVGVSVDGTTTPVKLIGPSAEPMEYIYRFDCSAALPTMLLTFYRYNTSGLDAIIRIGQITVSYGYVGVKQVPTDEYIFNTYEPLELYSATNETTRTYYAPFAIDGIDEDAIESIIVRLDSNISDSAGATQAWCGVGSYLAAVAGRDGAVINEKVGLPNDSLVSDQGFIPLTYPTGSNIRYFLVRTATDGGNVADVAIYLIGIKTV